MNETPSQPNEQSRTGDSTADGTARIADHAAHAGHAIVDELRVLRRSSSDRVVAGVMGGLGLRLGIDPVVLRIVTAVLALFGGVGVLIYAIAWLLLPADDQAGSVLDQALGRVEPRQPNAGPLALGLGLAALISAGVVVSGSVVSGPLLIGAAAAGYLLLRRRDEHADAEHVAAAQDSTLAPGAHDDLPRSWPDHPVETTEQSGLYAPPESTDVPETADDSAEAARATGTLDDAAHAGSPVTDEATSSPEIDDAGPGTGWPDPPDWTPPPHDGRWAPPTLDESTQLTKPAKTKHRSPLAAITFCAALIAVGILAIVDASTNFPLGLYFAIPLGIIGLGLVIGSFFGRSRGLIALGILLALALVPAKLADEWDAGDWGTQTYERVPTLDALPPQPVDIHGGQVTYDLTQLELGADESGTLEIDMGGGDLTILVPPEVDLEVDASIGAGELIVRDDTAAGVGSEISRTFAGEGVGGGTIVLRIDMGAGSVKVVNG